MHAKELGYACKVFEIDHALFSELPKLRLWLLGIGRTQRHELALSWVSDLIAELLRRCSQFPSAKLVGDIVDINSADEVARKTRSQAPDLHPSTPHPCLSPEYIGNVKQCEHMQMSIFHSNSCYFV